MRATFAADAGTPSGLSLEEATRRLLAEGPNELPSAKPRTTLALAFERNGDARVGGNRQARDT